MQSEESAVVTRSYVGVQELEVNFHGREGSAYKKLRSVQQVCHLLDRVTDGLSAEESRAVAHAIRGTPALCRSSYACYYPEVVRRTPQDGRDA